MGCQFHALHPDDLALPFDYGPFGARAAGYFEALENFFDFAWPAGIAEGNPIARTPVADCGGWGGLSGICSEVFAKG